MTTYVVRVHSKSGSWNAKGRFTKKANAEKLARELRAHIRKTHAMGATRISVEKSKSRKRSSSGFLGFGGGGNWNPF